MTGPPGMEKEVKERTADVKREVRFIKDGEGLMKTGNSPPGPQLPPQALKSSLGPPDSSH